MENRNSRGRFSFDDGDGSSSSTTSSSQPVVEEEEELLDPRIHSELEKLNSCTQKINKFEKELEETNEQFRILLSAHAGELEKLMRKLGNSIERARPFYEAQAKAEHLRRKCLEAAASFQRANDIHHEAKKSVQQAEGRYSGSHFDGSCQEVLNRLTMQVMDAEQQKSASSQSHLSLSHQYIEAQKGVYELERTLHKDIHRSKAYFDMKNSLNSTLNDLKTLTMSLTESLALAKREYSNSLSRLEFISEEIHSSRMKSRTPGEGAEEEREKVRK